MSENIKLAITNAYLNIAHINDLKKLNNNKFPEFESLEKKIIFDSYQDIDKNSKINFSLEDFEKEIYNLFEKKEPTQAFAEYHDLEPWLDSNRRVNKEIRFSAYKRLLAKEGKEGIIEQMDADTYKILDSCHNPNDLKREWDRRGLVYGHVQSGKTANYIGLVNRAIDAGYRIIIILTGITEDLRSQTQSRVDEGVIGKRENKKIGIGNYLYNLDEIIPATTLKKDLKSEDDWRDQVINKNKNSIWVIKKNKTVLENLILWLNKQKEENHNKIINTPFLIIDDEADNASIKSMTKKDYEEWGLGQKLLEKDLDNLTNEEEEILEKAQNKVIQAINRNIRVALSLMAHKSFVAYTATPYSIINQTNKDFEKSVKIRGIEFKIDKNTDLFPRDFIIPIKAGEKYLGVERIFSTNIDEKLPIVINLSEKYDEDLENYYFPSKRNTNYSFEFIPKSLEDAILHFLITIVIRKYRNHNDYNSLLVHTSHLTENADYLADKIDFFINKLRDSLYSNSGGYFERIQKIFEKIKLNSRNNLFKKYFNQDYDFPEKISIKNILNIIESKRGEDGEYIYAPFEIVSYHSSNNKELKHKNHTLKYDLKDLDGNKKYKNYIVIGGNRLSRGLTIEGLSVSYFVRNSSRQDSLYQMGRWFGYRMGYEDLVRIFMPNDQIKWYESIYKLEMDLRRDFEQNNDEDTKLLPEDAIIKLACYTDENQHLPIELRKKFPSICDPNKLRNTRKQPMSFCGTTSTNRIINNESIQEKNLLNIKKVFEKLKNDSSTELFDVSHESVPLEFKSNKNVNFKNVDYKYIIEILSQYEAHDSKKNELSSLINFISENKENLGKWSLVLVNKGDKENIVEGFKMDYYKNKEKVYAQPITSIKRKSKLEDNGETLYFPSILDKQSDHVFDIINTENYKEYENCEDGFKQSDVVKKYRNKSGIPILMVYPTYTNIEEEENKKTKIFPLLYCIIPSIDGIKKVTYIVRKK